MGEASLPSELERRPAGVAVRQCGVEDGGQMISRTTLVHRCAALLVFISALCALTPAFAITSQTFSGANAATLGPFGLDEGLTIVDWSGVTGATTQARLVGVSTGTAYLILAQSDDSSGSRVYPVYTAESYRLEVTGTGPWTITVRQPRPAKAPLESYIAGEAGAWVSEPFFLSPGYHWFSSGWDDSLAGVQLWPLLPKDPLVPGVYPPSIINITPSAPATISGNFTGGLYVLSSQRASSWGVSISTDPVPPRDVYRFYNLRTGTHFYTISAEERNMVIAKCPTIYRYEGVAYTSNPMNSSNNRPLYRFFNMKTGSHFYTASHEECGRVIALWPTIYRYEGVAYLVSVQEGVPVHRFYNSHTGAHFFTSSDEEQQFVLQRWPQFKYEGVAFYIAR